MRTHRDIYSRLVHRRGFVIRQRTGHAEPPVEIRDASNALVGYIGSTGQFYARIGVQFQGMTTAQRNALAQADRGPGTVIRNTDNGVLEQNIGTAASPVWRSVANVSGEFNQAGTLAARPVASAVQVGVQYFATDDLGGTLYRSDGVVWAKEAVSVNDPRLTDQRTPLDNSVSSAKIQAGAVLPANMGAGTFNFQGLQQGGMAVQRTPYGSYRHMEMGQLVTTFAGFSSTSAGGAAFVDPFASPPQVVWNENGFTDNNISFPTGLTYYIANVTGSSFQLVSQSDGQAGHAKSFTWMAEGPD